MGRQYRYFQSDPQNARPAWLRFFQMHKDSPPPCRSAGSRARRLPCGAKDFHGDAESRSNLAVPPVEISSTPIPVSFWAKSTRPVLSVTLRMARRMGARTSDDIDGLECGNDRGKFYQ